MSTTTIIAKPALELLRSLINDPLAAAGSVDMSELTGAQA